MAVQSISRRSEGMAQVDDQPMRLAIFTTHPVQYHVPLFRELAAREEVAPVVYFASRHGVDVSADAGFGTAFKWDVPLLEGYEHVFLENRARRPDVSSFRGVRVPQLQEEWSRRSFDAALVLGWQTYGHLQAMRAAQVLGLPLLLRGESHLLTRPVSPGRAALRSLLWLPVRDRLYRRIFSKVDAFLPIGKRNHDYYLHFGVPERKMFRAPYCVDNEQFSRSPSARAEARSRVRGALAIAPGTTVFTCSGKLIARKCPFDVLKAFRSVVDQGSDVHLLYLGDGPEHGELEREIARAGLQGRVSISGFVNQSEIPDWYAASDCLVLASLAEAWGMVVNEAMAGGLAVLVSDVVGCAPDLVREGENGSTFPPQDIMALAERMLQFARRTEGERAAMGARSREIIGSYTVPHVADAVVEALKCIRRPARGGA